MRIENPFKGHLIEKPPKLNYTKYVSPLKSPDFDVTNTKWFILTSGESKAGQNHCVAHEMDTQMA